MSLWNWLFHRRQREEELDEEVQAHLRMAAQERMEQGETAEQARTSAVREFGNVTLVKEVTRDVWGFRWLETLLQDLRYGLRMLAKNPGFTAVAVLTLALGIGANAAMFSYLDFMLLRPLSLPGANRLVVVTRGETTFLSFPDYSDYCDRSQAFAALSATTPTEATFDLEGRSEAITAEAVSASYEDVMRAPLVLGRWFSDEDQPVAVISYNAWQRRFHADPNVLGKVVRSTAQMYTVIGVAPPEFTGLFAPMNTDLWVPLRYWTKQIPRIAAEMNDRSAHSVMIFGRLGPGVTPAEAAANLSGIDVQVRRQTSPTEGFTTPLAVTTVHGTPSLDTRRESIPVITLLVTVVALVLLIACVNIGNLLLARGAARQREILLRAALGASRFRLLRHFMMESLLLALAGGLCGLLVGAWTNRLLERLVPSLVIGMSLQLRVDGRVMAFTLAVTLLATLLFGLLPAWHLARSGVFTALKGEAPLHQRFQLRHASLAGQVTISFMLLLSAGLFLRSILRLQSTDPGFAVENRLYAWTYISPPEFTPETGRRFYAKTLEDLRALPGVRSAALTHFLPLLDEGSDCASDGLAPPFDATLGKIDSGYLAIMKIPLLEGRDFSQTDGPNSPPVVIVNETLARRVWPEASAVGRRLTIGCQKPITARVVGVARDSKVRSLTEAPHPHFYRPFLQNYTGLATIVVETTSKPSQMAETVRRTLLAEDKSVRIYALEPVAGHVEHTYWQARWVASLLLTFGLLALVLATVGLYGTTSYRVTQRTREIGVRMAIGAQPREVHWLILRQGLTITLVGILIGLLAWLVLARLLSRFLYGVSSMDPLTLAGTGLLWLAVAALACYLPARRATKVDPMVALRYE